MVEEVDIHNSKKRYSDFIERINKLPSSEGKETLIKYASWHEEQLQKNKMSYSSCRRSLEIAFRLIDEFPKLNELTQAKLEKWFEKETHRNKLHRTGGDSVKESNKSISLGTIAKTQSQLLKFIKFVEFLKMNKPLSLFNSKRIPIPQIAQFCFSDTTASKTYEPPSINQTQIKELIDYLLSTGNYIDEVVGTLTAYLNDSGCMLTEAISLRHENFHFEEGYWLAQIQQSKTRTRTNVILLSKEYMSNWVGKCPTKNDKKGLFFCNKKGEKLNYGLIRNSLKKALKVKGINWKENSSFHYLNSYLNCFECVFNMDDDDYSIFGRCPMCGKSLGISATYKPYCSPTCRDEYRLTHKN